jgi:hypothetical protein
MLPMHLSRLHILAASVFGAALSGLLTGCLSTKPPENPDLSAIKLWKPNLLFLNRAPHDSLYVEVDAVEGAEPDDTVLKALKGFLQQHCDKPAGITVVRDDVISRTAAVGYHHDALALQYLDGPPTATNSSPAFMYILYYDSNLTADPTALPRRPVHKHLSLKAASRYTSPENPHVHLAPYPAAIYVDRRYLGVGSRSFEPLAICHEAAHLLGLTKNDTHAAQLHCRTKPCLMNASINFGLGKFILGRNPFTQTNLCENCRADLLADAAERTPDNLRFLGPMLVRSESNYHVVSLPSEVKLFSGDLSAFNTATFSEQARQDGKRTKGRFPHRFWADFSDQNSQPEEEFARIAHAKTDWNSLVRYAGTQLVARAQHRLGQFYLAADNPSRNPEQAIKWFRAAAEGGDTEAQKALAQCYLDGTGVPRDELEAYKWFALAAKQGSKSSAKQRDVLAKKFTASQLAEAKTRLDAPAP